MSEGRESATNLTKAVSGTANSNPMNPHSQPQNSMPMVTATGPDQKTGADQLGNQEVRGNQMKKKDRDRNGDEGTRGVELQESRCQRNCGSQQKAKKWNQIQKRAHDPERHGSRHSERHKNHRGTCGHNGSDDKVPEHKSSDHVTEIADERGNIDFAFEHVVEPNTHLFF